MPDLDFTQTSLPCSPTAEQAVIGSLLLDSEKISEVINVLKTEHFYSDVNRDIYKVIHTLFAGGKKVDVISVINQCVIQGVFKEEIEAKKYLVACADSVASINSILTYVKIITDKYLLRSLIVAAREIIEKASHCTEESESVVDFAEKKIFDIREGVDNKELVPLSSVAFGQLKEFCERVDEYRANGGKTVLTGLTTGFGDLDRLIYGLNKTELIVLAARPGMGKTSLALNIAINAAKRHKNKAVCIFSLEMSKEELVSRMISSEAEVSADIMKTGRIPATDNATVKKVMDVTEKMNLLDIYIDDTPGTTVSVIKAKLRRIRDLGLVIIDFLQLINSVENYHGNRVSEISEITRNLKIMAKELNVPVIVLSQLSRGTEQRNEKRPMLSDLRDSGSIEQDADIVMFLYNNSYYDKSDQNKNLCECIVAKNRHGSTGTVNLGWLGEFTSFRELVQKNGPTAPSEPPPGY